MRYFEIFLRYPVPKTENCVTQQGIFCWFLRPKIFTNLCILSSCGPALPFFSAPNTSRWRPAPAVACCTPPKTQAVPKTMTLYSKTSGTRNQWWVQSQLKGLQRCSEAVGTCLSVMVKWIYIWYMLKNLSHLSMLIFFTSFCCPKYLVPPVSSNLMAFYVDFIPPSAVQPHSTSERRFRWYAAAWKQLKVGEYVCWTWKCQSIFVHCLPT